MSDYDPDRVITSGLVPGRLGKGASQMSIRSDGTGRGTHVILNGCILDNVATLKFEIAGRRNRAKVTLTFVNVDLRLEMEAAPSEALQALEAELALRP